MTALILAGAAFVFAALLSPHLRRALHVFQLEAYKRDNFLAWCRAHRRDSLFLRAVGAGKKPLVMTGRATRLLITATVLSALVVVLPSVAVAVVAGTVPAVVTLVACAVALGVLGVASVLVVADLLLTPVQRSINKRFLKAAEARLRAVAPLVIGVTGSYGKTSTKFAAAGLLGAPGEVFTTPGSYNTTMGVVRAINEGLTEGHRYFVVEMGARKRGDIAEIASFVQPRIGVLTAIGPAHLESFGSLEDIARAKYELIEALPPDGVAVMNVDNPLVRSAAETTTHVGVVRYGLEPEGAPDVTATEIETTASGTAFTIVDARNEGSARTTSRLLGRHAIGNVLGAAATALATGRSLTDVAGAIAELEPVEHRLQIIEGAGGVTVIDDAFNSNPDGAAAALEALAAMPAGRRVVVTPGIVELGPLQAEANEAFGAHAGRVADAVIVVARLNRDALVAGARRGGRARVISVDTLAAAQESLKGLIGPGDVVLFENDLPDHYET